MTSDFNEEISRILEAIQRGEEGAKQRLFSLVYEELKKIAKNRRSAVGELSMHTTTLVHEAYIKMIKEKDSSWANRHHFFYAAARAMRNILVDHARHDQAQKRGGGQNHVELDENQVPDNEAPDLVKLDEALDRLESLYPDIAKLVLLKFFAGLRREDIAEVQKTSVSTVARNWAFARAWLAKEMK